MMTPSRTSSGLRTEDDADHPRFSGTRFGTINVNVNATIQSTTPSTDAMWNPSTTTSGDREDDTIPPPDKENMNA